MDSGRAHRAKLVGSGDEGGAEWAVVMMGALFLLTLTLWIGVRFVVFEAAGAAASRGVQVAQTSGSSDREVQRVSEALAGSSGMVSAVKVRLVTTPTTVEVTVRARSVLAGWLTRTQTGPRLLFTPEQS